MSYNADLILIVDESGSMREQRFATIKSVNGLVQAQRNLPGDLAITLVTFNAETCMRRTRVRAWDFDYITPEDYFPSGGTALCDAVCRVLDTASRWDAPPGTGRIVAIVTDGVTNADRERSKADVKARVDKLTADGWEFIFVGSGVDAISEGVQYGISQSLQANLTHDSGTRLAYSVTSQAISDLRAKP